LPPSEGVDGDARDSRGNHRVVGGIEIMAQRRERRCGISHTAVTSWGVAALVFFGIHERAERAGGYLPVTQSE
jgi:hypothetical protein